MPSLATAYDARRDRRRKRGRVAVGVTVLLAGVAGVLAAILLATSPAAERLGLGTYEARRLAGILAGVGVPAIFGGVVTVVPTGTRDRVRAAIGICIALVGVAAFGWAYPSSWLGRGPPSVTPVILGVYALGAFLGLWGVLAALATFRRRNDPVDTVTLEVTRAGETRTVEVSEDELDRRDVSSLVASAYDD